jgi:hypothetical protein
MPVPAMNPSDQQEINFSFEISTRSKVPAMIGGGN